MGANLAYAALLQTIVWLGAVLLAAAVLYVWWLVVNVALDGLLELKRRWGGGMSHKVDERGELGPLEPAHNPGVGVSGSSPRRQQLDAAARISNRRGA